ncbi:F-box domain-containing protein [Psidium guajava]|nr:F-box domain-containing protein [Psidium guajava]
MSSTSSPAPFAAAAAEPPDPMISLLSIVLCDSLCRAASGAPLPLRP